MTFTSIMLTCATLSASNSTAFAVSTISNPVDNYNYGQTATVACYGTHTPYSENISVKIVKGTIIKDEKTVMVDHGGSWECDFDPDLEWEAGSDWKIQVWKGSAMEDEVGFNVIDD